MRSVWVCAALAATAAVCQTTAEDTEESCLRWSTGDWCVQVADQPVSSLQVTANIELHRGSLKSRKVEEEAHQTRTADASNKEAKRKAEEEAKKKAEEEEARLKAEQEAKRKAEEEAKKRAEEEARLKSEQEAKRKAEEEAKSNAEEARLKAEQEANIKAEQEAKHEAEEEAKKKAEEEARLKAEREAKRRDEEEAKKKAKEEARLKAEQEAKRKAGEEAKKQEAKRKAEEEAKKKAEEEAASSRLSLAALSSSLARVLRDAKQMRTRDDVLFVFVPVVIGIVGILVVCVICVGNSDAPYRLSDVFSSKPTRSTQRQAQRQRHAQPLYSQTTWGSRSSSISGTATGWPSGGSSMGYNLPDERPKGWTPSARQIRWPGASSATSRGSPVIQTRRSDSLSAKPPQNGSWFGSFFGSTPAPPQREAQAQQQPVPQALVLSPQASEFADPGTLEDSRGSHDDPGAMGAHFEPPHVRDSNNMRLTKEHTQNFLCGHMIWTKAPSKYKIDARFLIDASQDELSIPVYNPGGACVINILIRKTPVPGSSVPRRKALLTFSVRHTSDISSMIAQPLATCTPIGGADLLQINGLYGNEWGTLEPDDEGGTTWSATHKDGHLALKISGVPDKIAMHHDARRVVIEPEINMDVRNYHGEAVALMTSRMQRGNLILVVDVVAGVDLCLVLLCSISTLLLRSKPLQE